MSPGEPPTEHAGLRPASPQRFQPPWRPLIWRRIVVGAARSRGRSLRLGSGGQRAEHAIADFGAENGELEPVRGQALIGVACDEPIAAEAGHIPGALGRV
jgi:hypothetical protein